MVCWTVNIQLQGQRVNRQGLSDTHGIIHTFLATRWIRSEYQSYHPSSWENWSFYNFVWPCWRRWPPPPLPQSLQRCPHATWEMTPRLPRISRDLSPAVTLMTFAREVKSFGSPRSGSDRFVVNFSTITLCEFCTFTFWGEGVGGCAAHKIIKS